MDCKALFAYFGHCAPWIAEKHYQLSINEVPHIQCIAESIALCISPVLGAVPPLGTEPSTELLRGVQWISAHAHIAICRAQLRVIYM